MKRTYRPRRNTSRRRRVYRKRTLGAKSGRRMQRIATSYVKKKYTTVLELVCPLNINSVELTVSHIGGVNTNSVVTNNNITLGRCNPDGMLFTDMNLYQFFKISGVGFKLIFPEGTDPSNTACQWSMGYSANQIIKPSVDFARLQALQTYQTSSCDSGRPVSRFFKTTTALKRLGIDWCNTREITNFYPALATQQQTLYGGQLPVNQGSSTNIKVYRSSNSTAAG